MKPGHRTNAANVGTAYWQLRERRSRSIIGSSAGCPAMLHTLTAYKELAVALVGPESRSVISRGVAEPTLETCQVVVESVESTTTEPSPASQEAEEDEEPLQTPAAVLQQEEEEEKTETEEEEIFFAGEEQPAAISVEMEEAPGPSSVQVVTPRRVTLQTPIPRRSGQRGEQSPALEGQTKSLISLCRETVAIGRDLIHGFKGFSANWNQCPASWSEFCQNFSNWSSEQLLTAREILVAIRQQTAATNALRHTLLAGHGAAPQGVESDRS
uniref:uncharacterized protein n=1 Tax=Pristiophorus japonicus TaxID=55135 RepID=UPI00398EBCC5